MTPEEHDDEVKAYIAFCFAVPALLVVVAIAKAFAPH